MKQKTILIGSLLLALILSSTVMAAPPPDRGRNAAPQEMKKERVSGMVESVTGQRAIIRTGSGHRVTVNLGPESYWREKGYRLVPGRQVTVEGWHRDGEGGPVFAGGIWGPDFYFELSNSAGFPYWADQDDYWDGWYPTYDYYDVYYHGAGPWVYGPPPAWWWGPPPPRYWWARHHFYGRPGFRWGWRWEDRGWYGRPHPGWGHGGYGYRHGGRSGDHGGWNDDHHDGGWNGDGGNGGNDGGHGGDQRGGERRH